MPQHTHKFPKGKNRMNKLLQKGWRISSTTARLSREAETPTAQVRASNGHADQRYLTVFSLFYQRHLPFYSASFSGAALGKQRKREELRGEAETQKALNQGGVNPRGNGFNGPISSLDATPCPKHGEGIRTH